MSERYIAGATIRSGCGGARVTYHPEWPGSLPWVSYIRGAAYRHNGTLRGALFDLERKGFSFKRSELWQPQEGSA